jgi:hypothetical protein
LLSNQLTISTKKKSRIISFKKLTSRSWGKTTTRASTATTLVEAPPPRPIETQAPTDHVYPAPKPAVTFAPPQNPLRSKTAPEPEPGEGLEKSVKQPYRLGLFPLHPPPSDTLLAANCPVDIIALHGINGDAYTTFTSPTSTSFWLRDFLPHSFPGARIYTFGYDASVIFSLGTGDISSFAGSLLEDVRNVRLGREEQRRPIVWVVHSMGGLVVKKVSILSDEIEKQRD